MGQYYSCVMCNEKNERQVYYTYGLKLMEHSWWKNPPMMFISKLLYKNPMQVCWVGDYADEEYDWENVEEKDFWYGSAWGDSNKTELTENVKGILLDGKYLVNHSLKIYVDCDKYKKQNERNGWIIYPISLLTAKGNGRGGGDYHENNPDFDHVGDWACNTISVEDEIPAGFEEVEYNFVEE